MQKVNRKRGGDTMTSFSKNIDALLAKKARKLNGQCTCCCACF